MTDYDRRQADSFGGQVSWHKAAEADEAVGDAYRKITSLKMEMDQFEEIPSYLMPLYREIMKAMEALVKARKETGQVRGMVRRVAR